MCACGAVRWPGDRGSAAGVKRTPWRTSIAVLFLLGLLAASVLPDPWKGRTALPGMVHDCAHVLAFATAFLLVNGRYSNWRKALLLGAGLIALGVTLEFLEAAEFNNRLEYRD